ncbi:MAG: hypothetical protein C0624_05670 [Desulfuromonas sp.]|nr:MAG: hypothetical protein C0624_05670 [Desulfuromonas sp.]
MTGREEIDHLNGVNSTRHEMKRIQPGIPKIKTQGLRPLTPPYSFVTPQKSRQKRAPDLLARHRTAGSLRSNTPRRAFAIRCAQLFGLFRREAPLLRLRHTGRGRYFDCSTAFPGLRAQSPSTWILILPSGEHASRLDYNFRLARAPDRRVTEFGVPSFAYFSWASKKSKALPGAPGGVECGDVSYAL